jgi:hypothetical protein
MSSGSLITTAWDVLRLGIEKMIRRVVADVLNKKS